MRLSEFKRLIEAEFGPGLQNATPANVREFLDRLQQDAYAACKSPRYVLVKEHAQSFEEVVKDFFARVLDLPESEAAILLWTVAFELAFAAIEHQYAEQLDPLFRAFEE
ncbi:MAG: hypothetical protein ABDI19_00330 [Armatimonadota bacterium]